MSHVWPAETAFERVDLFLEGQGCGSCEARLAVWGHRKRQVFTLQGPRLLVVRQGHCPEPDCPGHHESVSSWQEMAVAPPWLAIGWDVLAWIGHRRFARHWSVPQIRGELWDSHRIDLSEDAIEDYVRSYQTMVAARQGDLKELRKVYARRKSLVLSIDGIQPEKGHETLYVVRELTARRVWFAEPLRSSTNDEVRRLLERAKEIAASLRRPVAGWMSDKQDAFVQGIAAVFPGVPHAYCKNHFLRDLAEPVLEADRHAKVPMRRKVRGLRAIEQAVLHDRGPTPAEKDTTPATEKRAATPVTEKEAANEPSATGQVVLDYYAAVRGILNDDQGGPLHPPGLRMAEALGEVRQSLDRCVAAKKGGLRRSSCSG